MARRSRGPTDYWLSGLPAGTPIAELVRPAKIRRRIEHDYRELKHGLGPDHFEGRSWTGWHHHVTLVTAAHAFLTEQRPAPKADTADSPSARPSTPSVPAEPLDRHLHHLPPTHPRQSTSDTKSQTHPTESYQVGLPQPSLASPDSSVRPGWSARSVPRRWT